MISSIVSSTTNTAKYRKKISSHADVSMILRFNHYLHYITLLPTSSSNKSIYLYESISSEKEYEITEGFYQLPENIRLLAVKIADYLKYEWDSRQLIDKIEITDDEELSEQAKVAITLKDNAKDKVALFDKLLGDVFNKFKNHDEIWDITITYR